MNLSGETLSRWLREYNLPEPELAYPLQRDSVIVSLVLAFPDNSLGIVESTRFEIVSEGDWTLWHCKDMEDVRRALGEMAGSLGIAPPLRRLNFERVERNFKSNLFDAAEDEVIRLQKDIDETHPDWDVCEEWRVRIMKAKKKSKPSVQPQVEVQRTSFYLLLNQDAQRLRSDSRFLSYNLMGLYAGREGEVVSVEAAWNVAYVRGSSNVFAAAVEGSRVCENDPTWMMVNTESDLLQQLQESMQDRLTFIWDAPRIMPLLQAWHYRATGAKLSNSDQYLDLRSLCLVAYPQAQRADRPEALCQELGLRYTDENGIGGTLAAMQILLQDCVKKLTALPEPLRVALRLILRRVLPQDWLDALLLASEQAGFAPYLEMLEKRFKTFPSPIKESNGKRSDSAATMDDFLRAGGYLARAAGENYRQRDGQISFAQSVQDATTTHRPYLLEAGTGIGKTIGYALPLLLTGKRSYAATCTKNLQDQAWQKDIPLVLNALSLAGIQRSVSILKGKNNYACLQTVADWLEELGEIIHSRSDAFTLAAVLHWLLLTQTGWLSELGTLDSPYLVLRLGRDQAAPNLSEQWASIDPHRIAWEAAQTADLVLVNHSYVIAMAKNQSDNETGTTEVALFDEAHNLENSVTEALTLHFTPWNLKQEIGVLVRRSKDGKIQGIMRRLFEVPDLARLQVVKNFRDRFLELEKYLDMWCSACTQRLAEMCQNVTDYDPDTPVVFATKEFWIQDLKDSAQVLQEHLLGVEHSAAALLEVQAQQSILPNRVSASVSALLEHLQENAEALDHLLQSDEGNIHWGEAWVETDEQGFALLSGSMAYWQGVFHSTPLDVATWLKTTLYPLYAHRIFVSATLTVGDSFDSITERLGMSKDDDAQKPFMRIFPSPFNYQNQVLLSIFTDSPYPRGSLDALYVESLSRNIAELARLAQGRTLVLFTSRKTMREVGLRLQSYLESEEITVLLQTDLNRASLVERFRRAPKEGEKIILLGLRAFWEGVDVPGEPLTILAITRLPFDYAFHPVAIARRNHYQSQGFDRDYFREVVIPATFLHLRQMYGRLIRTEKDRGVCVFLDSRIASRGYGQYLLDRLPLSQQIAANSEQSLDAIRRFLAGEQVGVRIETQELPTQPETDFSPEQRAIINSPAPRILVRAAAGSGKTQVLIARIIRLIETGKARPDRILTMTFTNKARDVMIERLEQSLGISKAFELSRNVLTYHRFAARVIRQDIQGSGDQLELLGEASPEQVALLDYARKKAGLTERELSDEDALTILGYAQNGLVNEQELKEKLSSFEPYTAKLARFFLAYVERLRELKKTDYGEAIVRAVRILRDDLKAQQAWRGRFDYIFCDEYQDTTPAQAAMLSLIGQQANLFVVGDSAQSIYSWQGADPDNLLRFENDFPGTISYPLYKNYRCFPNLVRISSRFLERCGQSHGIRVEFNERRSNENQSVYYLRSADDMEEARSIAKLAQAGLALQIPSENPQPATVGVLARKWGLLEALELELIRQEIPYRFEGDTARGIFKDADLQPIISQAVDILRFHKLKRQMGNTPEGLAVQDLQAGKITLATELLQRAQKVKGVQIDTSKSSAYGKLMQALAQKPVETLTKLYDEEEKVSRIVLSTVHSQKGEQFDSVFVIGLEKGNSPHTPPKKHQEILEWRKKVQSLSHATWRNEILTDEDLQRLYDEEEQRIFYVAITRARFNLMICYAAQRHEFHHTQKYEKSDFLDKAHIPNLVREVASPDSIQITTPPAEEADAGYRYDGRTYLTQSGVRVRSKSEMLLADEFYRRGIYFEYEFPPENITDALPDFTLPDYGGAVIEHLGMLDKPAYQERWQHKAEEYGRVGTYFLTTTEMELAQGPTATVDRLRKLCCMHIQSQFGAEWLEMIDKVEGLRKSLQPDPNPRYRITRSDGAFIRGVFMLEDSRNEYIVVDLRPDQSVLNSEMEWCDDVIAGYAVRLGKKRV